MESPSIVALTRASSLGLRDFPHVFPPPGATFFSRVGFQGGILPGQKFSLSIPQQILMPAQQEGWLSQIAVGLASYGNGQNWSLTQNGVPVRDYTAVPVPIGAPETPVIRHIRLFPQQPVSLTFVNPAAAGQPNLSVSWSLYGWYYDPRGRRRI
jgi:hypothetical protein